MSRNYKLIWIILLIPFLLVGQANKLQFKPELGMSNLVGDFKSNNIFAKPGIDVGIHFDKMWNRIGLGLYTGFDFNGIDYHDILPNRITVPNITKSKESNQYNWRKFIFGIGPLYQFNLSEKFNVDLSFKLGFAKIFYPDYRQFVHVESPIKESYILFETNNKDIEKKINPMLRSTVRLNYKVNSKLSLSLGSNFTHVRDVIHSYSYLDAGFNPTMTTDELIKALAEANTITEKRKCHFNSLGLTLGIGYQLFKPKPLQDIPRPQPIDNSPNYTNVDSSCKRPLVQNEGFVQIPGIKSVPNWSDAYGSPQFLNQSGSDFLDPGYVQLSGNKNSGDAIYQALNPTNRIRLNSHYSVMIGARFFSNLNVLDYARIQIIAFNGILPTTGIHPSPSTDVAIIARSGKIKDCGTWSMYEFPVWTANKDFDHIAIQVFTNDLQSSTLLIDNMAICEVVNADPCKTIAVDKNGEPIIPSINLNSIPGFNCQPEAELDSFYNGSLLDLYGQSNGYDGTTNWYANSMDKCWSLGGTIPNYVNNYNCDDSLKALGIKMTCEELQKYFEKPDLDGLDNDKLPYLPPINNLSNVCTEIHPVTDDPKMAFGGRDIIYIHGLELDHIMKRIEGKKQARANWPDDASEFYKGGFYKNDVEKTWNDHINYFQKSKYNNRHLVVSYNCSQRLEVAIHAVLTQIYEAMEISKDVENLNQVGNNDCFGREYVIISQSTGAIVADAMLAIANQTKTDPALQAKWGKIGYIADRCKGHIARRGAFSGSDLATILVTLAKPTPGAATIAAGILNDGGGSLTDLTDPNKASIIRSSILVDLIPPITRDKWGPWEEKVPVPVLTVSGGHPTFFNEKDINKIATLGFGASGAIAPILPILSGQLGIIPTPSTIHSLALTALAASLSMKHIVHPGFDDGVITTDCATGRKYDFTTTSTFYANEPWRVFDMGLHGPRAVHYFLDQRKINSLTNFHSGASPYLSPSGMVQPLNSFSLRPSYPRHYTFIQAAGEHWIKHGPGPYPLDCCEYNTTAIGGSSNHEEQLVVSNINLYNVTNGIIDQSIRYEMGEEIKGRWIWIPSIKYFTKLGVTFPIPWYKEFWIWKRTYHNLKNPDLYDFDYVYKYLFKK